MLRGLVETREIWTVCCNSAQLIPRQHDLKMLSFIDSPFAQHLGFEQETPIMQIIPSAVNEN